MEIIPLELFLLHKKEAMPSLQGIFEVERTLARKLATSSCLMRVSQYNLEMMRTAYAGV